MKIRRSWDLRQNSKTVVSVIVTLMQVAGPDNKQQQEEGAINRDNTEYTKY